jgi:hypothetical protein
VGLYLWISNQERLVIDSNESVSLLTNCRKSITNAAPPFDPYQAIYMADLITVSYVALQ